MEEKMTTNMQPTTTVTMTEEERARFLAWREADRKQREEEQRQADLEAYRNLGAEVVEKAVARFDKVSEALKRAKSDTIRALMDLVRLKREVLGLKEDGQWSYTFTHPDRTKRITMGVYTLDGWEDTVEEGIELVMEYIQSLAGDDNSRALVGMVLQLLSKDATGNLKADKVLELRRIAEQSGSEDFMRGVELIEESHFRTVSKIYLRAEVRGEDKSWQRIPLSVTDCPVGGEEEEALLSTIRNEE